jgi:hypothetical protein
MLSSYSKRPPKVDQLQQLKQSVLGLVLECPFDQCNPADCQLFEIRQLELKDRFAWVMGLSGEELAAIWASHQMCVMAKKAAESK